METRREFLGGLAAASAAPAPADPAWLTVEEASALLRRKSLSPVELAQSCLERIRRLNPKLNAFITVLGEQALAGARQAEREIRGGGWRGPLHGIPVALKDLIDTAGIRTTAASAHYADHVPDADAEVVKRLKAAGAVLIGKTNLDEFAYNFTSETSHFGPARNPWNPRCTPGGSSGGSAIAVASGMCLAALGSDTGGSIRLPAALCGVTGLKPSYGRLSTEGVAPLAWSLDHVGPMCRSAHDAAIVLGALSWREPAAAAKTLRIGVPRGLYFEGLDPEVKDAIGEAVNELGRLSSGVREVDLPALTMSSQIPELPAAYLTVIQAEAYAFHENLLRSRPGLYHAATRRSIENGAVITAAAYIGARREMERLRAGSGRLFDAADVLATPASPGPAFEYGKPAGLIFLRNTAPWNLYGLPSISIPCGFTRAGLPVGLQLTAPARRDGAVLALAAAYQQATDWHKRRPAL